MNNISILRIKADKESWKEWKQILVNSRDTFCLNSEEETKSGGMFADSVAFVWGWLLLSSRTI